MKRPLPVERICKHVQYSYIVSYLGYGQVLHNIFVRFKYMRAGDQKQVILLEVCVLVLFTFLWFVPYQLNKHYRSVPGKRP